MKQTPILFLGDSPAVQSGLSRIGRDLAFIVSKMEEFRVGYLGRGGMPTRHLPFMQYTFSEHEQWGENWLEPVWQNFAGDEAGVVFTIWDPSRLLWFGHPVGMPNEAWLRKPPFKKWGYFAIDSAGPDNSLSTVIRAAVRGYDRVLGYTVFGATLLEKAVGKEVNFIPHGINMDTFMPRDGKGTRIGMGIGLEVPLVGCVMTNQARKDWALACETIALLRNALPNLMAWFKVDMLDRYWDLRALLTDFGIGDAVIVDDGNVSDQSMSYMYSACDVTFLPSLGEGFGYPIAESLACGVPCVHGNYAGGPEIVPNTEWLVDPVAWRYDTRYDCIRPVYRAIDWGQTIMRVFESRPDKEWCRSNVEHLNWPNLHQLWEKWFREGVK